MLSHKKRQQTLGEEILNSSSHFLAFILSAVGTYCLLVINPRTQNVNIVVGFAIFGVCMMFLYLVSGLYHSFPEGRWKRFLKILDHCAIFFMIAGTYTPFTLGVLYGPWGWSLLAVVWGLTVAGVTIKMFAGTKGGWISTLTYLTMGWVILVAMKPLSENMEVLGLYFLFAGGIAYSLGTIFYSLGYRFKFFHFIWHLFVISGSAFHFIAIYFYST